MRSPRKLLLSQTVWISLLLTPQLTSAVEQEAVPVRAGQVIRQTVPAGRVFVGTVEPARRSLVGSPVAGRVDTVFAEEGDQVDPDNESAPPLLQLETVTARIELESARADRDVAWHRLDELQQGPRAEVISRLKAEVARAQVRLQNEQQRLKRTESLFDRDAAGQSDLDEVRSAMLAAEQTHVIAELLYEESRLGTRAEQIAQAKAELARAEQNVKRYETRLNNHTIRAPFRGFVIRRLVDRGAWIAQGETVAEIVEVDPVEIRVAVPEKDIGRIRQGAAIKVEVDAIRGDGLHSGELIGTVYRIVPSADTRTRSFPVRIRLNNSQADGLPLLRPGMLSRVTLPVGPGEQALLVPRDSLVLDGGRTSVFIVRQDSTVVRIPVQTGGAHRQFIQVIPETPDELVPGMQVITEGNERLQSGQTVMLLENTPASQEVES